MARATRRYAPLLRPHARTVARCMRTISRSGAGARRAGGARAQAEAPLWLPCRCASLTRPHAADPPPQARFFDHEPHPLGSARGSCQDEFLMPRLLAAGQAALQRWTDAGGEGAGAITHLIVGGLTAPRASPGTQRPAAAWLACFRH